VTAGLLAIVLEGMGVNARSWQGWQLPIVTSNAHAAARDSSEPSGIVPVRALRADLAIHAVYSSASPRHHVRILRYASSDWQAGA